ncbi:MAG: TIGR00159 family protein [Oscillospiraceae bacterium]|nr:TIGR00159 family protein [Oscillospiraceae bacterium]
MTTTLFNGFLTSLMTIKLIDVVDILVVACLLYKVISMIRATRTSRIAKSIVLLLVVTWVTSVLHMNSLYFILSRIMEIGFIALVIMFQPELRRFLERVGSKSLKEIVGAGRGESQEVDRAIEAVVTACESMSKTRTGALIVFERNMLLDEYFKTGTVLDASISDELLRNIFFPKAALHDGAVILRRGRVAAAGCVLPLSENTHLSSDLGTRHRAGIGMSESSDAVVVIVSEETGTISAALGGMLKRHLAPRTLERLLTNELVNGQEDRKPANFYERFRGRLTRKGDRREK